MPVNTISFACIHLSMMRFRFTYKSIIRHSNAVLMIRCGQQRERQKERERTRKTETAALLMRETGREKEKKT